MAVPLNQALRVGAYVVKQHLRGRQALSAGADAGAAVPLQPGLRRLRQDRLPGRDPQPAPVGRGLPGGGRRVRRAGGGDRRRRAAAAQGDAADRRGHRWRASKFVYLCTNALLLEKKIDQYKPHPYFTWDVHLDGDREQHDRSVSQDGVYDRAVAAHEGGEGARLPRQHQRHAVRRRASRSAWRRFFDDVTAMGVDGIMISPGYAYERAPDQRAFPQPAQDQGAVPRHLPPRPRASGLEVQPVVAVPGLPGRQPDATTARPGATRRATCSAGSGPATCWARATPRRFKELMEDDRLGPLRHRQLREMRRLHGALRLRGDGGGRCGAPAAGRRGGGAARPAHRRADGAGDPARSTSARPSTCSAATCRRWWSGYATAPPPAAVEDVVDAAD